MIYVLFTVGSFSTYNSIGLRLDAGGVNRPSGHLDETTAGDISGYIVLHSKSASIFSLRTITLSFFKIKND